jgi:FKBP-type peptidyl-prolyl cis-trans isomerase SlyD
MADERSNLVEDGKVVSIHYTLTDDSGDVLDSSAAGQPLDYLHGAGNLIPGLESRLAGQTPGTHLNVAVPPEEAYGEHDPRAIQEVPREAFPAGVDIQPGMQFRAEGPGGETVPVWIADVTAESVTVDFNHPLAGETLHFDVTVLSVRDASTEEIEHGHPHGPDGHSHG